MMCLLASVGASYGCSPAGSASSTALVGGDADVGASPDARAEAPPGESPVTPSEGSSEGAPEGPKAGAFSVDRLVANDAKQSAEHVDPSLKNAWGLAAGPSTFWWVADNGTNASTLYDGEGVKQSLEVAVGGAPTGLVFNDATSGFVVSDGTNSGPARFIFAAEDGTISAWSPAVPPPGPSKQTFVVFRATGAIYKGLAIRGDRLFATDFHGAHVDVLDASWKRVDLGGGAFVDPDVPAGYAPFGIRVVSDMLIVTYAKQDAAREDDVKGAGFGFVDAFDASGTLRFRVATRGALNAPWGIAQAPSSFGAFGGALLIGNFGDGRIHGYDLSSCGATGCASMGALPDGAGAPIAIDGLWALDFGKGNAMTGDTGALYFTAGPNDEADGTFGRIVPAP